MAHTHRIIAHLAAWQAAQKESPAARDIREYFASIQKETTMPTQAQQPAQPDNQHVALRLPATDRFCRDVLCTAAECGYEWFEFKRTATYKAQDGDIPEWQAAEVYEIDCDGDGGVLSGPHTVTLDVLREGLARIVNGGMYDPDIKGQRPGAGDVAMIYRQQVAAAMLADDAGCIDADLADCIMQATVLRCIRYG